MDKKLKGKQASFCHEYMVDMNATQAAIRAGYSPKTACSIGVENLRKPHVKQEIARLEKEKSEAIMVTVKDVVQGILDVVNDAKRTIYDIDGNGTMADRNAALKGYDLLGKHLGMFNGIDPSASKSITNVSIVMDK